jgi:hypothetical protein
VGYINITMGNGFNFVTAHLRETNNDLTTLIPQCPDGTRVYVWHVPEQTFEPPATFLADQGGWDRSFDLSPGVGFVVYTTQSWTMTIAGEILQGWLTNAIAGSNRFSLIATIVPQAGQLSADLRFPGIDGCNVYRFRTGSMSYSDALTYYDGFGWFSASGGTTPNGPAIFVGEAFMVQNPGPDTNWIRNFYIQARSSRRAAGQYPASATKIRRLILAGKYLKLDILNPASEVFNIEFSADLSSWTSAGAGQRGTSWSAPRPASAQGYYRLASP